VNPYRATIQQAKFREISEACGRIEHRKAVLERMILEHLCVIGVPPEALDDQTRLQLSKTPLPKAWRLNLYQTLGKTLFQPLSSDSLLHNSVSYNNGMLIGVFHNLEAAIARTELGQEKQTEWNEVMLPHEAEYQHAKDETKKVLALITVEQSPAQRDFVAGYKSGLTAIFSIGDLLAKNYDTIKIYLFLLMLGEYIKCFRTVAELCEFAKQEMGPDFPKEPQSFHKACQRIMFSYGRPRKSRRRPGLADARLARVR
jgi:hypothetical protein